jgi:hypothetical protein
MMTRSPIKVFNDLLSGTNRMQASEAVTKVLNGPRDPRVAGGKVRSEWGYMGGVAGLLATTPVACPAV